MLNIERMIQSAREALGWPYVSPGTNDANGIDCSGLFVKMYRDQGISIYHGSNSIFHQYCSETGKLSKVSQLQVGMAVFKCKEWTESDKNNKWYGKEPGNLSHIGFVVSVNPLEIIHASSVSGCVTTDTKIGKWAYWGLLKDVDYSSEPGPSPEPEPTPVAEYATVWSENGKPVKMRCSKNTKSKNYGLYDELPVGTIVEVLGSEGKWTQVNHGYRQGWYIMTEFLHFDGDDQPIDLDAPCSVFIAGVSEEEARKIKQMYPQAEISYG